MTRIHDGDAWEEMSDPPASELCTGGTKRSQKSDYFEIINNLSLETFGFLVAQSPF